MRRPSADDPGRLLAGLLGRQWIDHPGAEAGGEPVHRAALGERLLEHRSRRRDAGAGGGHDLDRAA